MHIQMIKKKKNCIFKTVEEKGGSEVNKTQCIYTNQVL